jgi:hypothetical protein
MQTYAMGETVTFGQDLGLSQHGIRCRDKLLPWSDVAGIRLNLYRDVIIMVKREDKRLSQQLVPHAGIANLMIFSAMVEQILKPDRDGQQADTSKSTARGGIGELSARLGQDVRELLMQGYTPTDIQEMIAQREKGIENDRGE